MALSLKLSQSVVNYTSLNFSDASGEYSSTNLTGWGAPNIAISAVKYAHIIVYFEQAGYDIDLIEDLGIDFTTATYNDLVYNIPSTLLGGEAGSLIHDGVYTIDYQISTDVTWVEEAATNYTTSATIMTYYEVQESVYQRIKLLPNYYTCSDCTNLYVKETSTIFMLLQALIASTQYSNTAKYEGILSTLTDILSFDSNNCTSCGC